MFWKVVSASLLLVSAGWAQNPASPTQPRIPRSPFASPIQLAPAKSGSAKSNAAKPAAAARSAPAKSADASAAKKTQVRSKVTAAAQPASTAGHADSRVSSAHNRDPFLSPVSIETAGGMVSSPACRTGGKRCLTIGRIELKGVVHADSGFIAVVVNSSNRAYFLRENDPLFDGYVVRITKDEVTFRETGKDHSGRPTTREVTKRLNTPAV